VKRRNFRVSALSGFTTMRYINLHFTYLLTYFPVSPGSAEALVQKH